MEKLRELREEKRITQVTLGDELGISQQRISKLENGEVEASEKLLKKISEYFNVSVDYLLGLSPKRENSEICNEMLTPNNLIMLYRKLSERDRSIVNTLLQSNTTKL